MSSRRKGIAYSVRVLRLERYVAGMSWSTIPPHLRTRLISHGQKVCELYKAALYDLKAKNRDVLKYRYHAVLMRARFEENRNIKDAVLARKMLEDGWAELKQIEAPYPYKYPDAPGGAAYGRETVFNDSVSIFHCCLPHNLLQMFKFRISACPFVLLKMCFCL
ncbi:unnamed protein product [Schistosoma bovis]|nr:unnamed protein product [Schistosoma bovis]